MDKKQVNNEVIARFDKLIAKNRLAHAYLFVGPRYSGKTQTALYLAGMVNCEADMSKPCGTCSSCRKIAAGGHPDVHVLGNEDLERIKIEDIRFLLNRAHLMAYEAKIKVFIIRDIERMTTEAANALLKTLEEPALNTLIILTTSIPEANLDTIISRCHVIKFFALSGNELEKLLVDEGFVHDEARFLSVYSEGCLGRARQLAEASIMLRRNKVIDQVLLNRQNEVFLKELAADPHETSEALRLLLFFFRDVLLFKSGVTTKKLVHHTYLGELERFAKRSVDELGNIVRQIVKIKGLSDENLNVKMSLSLLREQVWAN